MNQRKLTDAIYNGVTYLFSSLSLIVLVSLLLFIFQKGLGSLSFDLFTKSYWSENYMVSLNSDQATSFARPGNLPEGASFSERFGIALSDGVNAQKEATIDIVYIDPASPFMSALNLSAGPDQGKPVTINTNMVLQKISYLNANDVTRSAGIIVGQNADQTIKAIEASKTITGAYVQSKGGGIQGSLIATIYLILISLALAMPLGIMTAIYLNEYASKNRLAPIIRSSIELLTGVPSIVFGLMGVLVLFPITALFRAQGTSILLGALTLSVVLLPVIIRTTEESLKVVPQSFRDASLSLGANQSQTIFKIVLPSAIPGILTAALLSIGRIIGESAALIYTMGTFVNDRPEVLKGATSLAVQIWSIMSGEQPNFALASAISIVILAIVLTMNLSVKLLANKYRKTW